VAEKKTCPKCGAEVFASDDVCLDCGADLVAAWHEEEKQEAAPSEVPRDRAASEAAREVLEGPEPEEATSAMYWVWVPPAAPPTRYRVLRIYQYVCMIAAWMSLASGLLGAIGIALTSLFIPGLLGAIPAPEEIVGLASAIVPALLGLLFWAFTLRAIVEAIQVYLDIEQNTRRTAEAAES